MSYRLETLAANDGWKFKGTFKTVQAAWRKAQDIIGRGKTSTDYVFKSYRIFEIESNGWSSFGKIQVRPSVHEIGVMIAEKISGQKVEAWLE